MTATQKKSLPRELLHELADFLRRSVPGRWGFALTLLLVIVALAAPCTEDAVQVSPEGPICGRQAIGPFRAWWVTVKDGKGSPYEIQNQFPSLKDFVTDWRDLRRVMRKVEETIRDEYQLIPLK